MNQNQVTFEKKTSLKSTWKKALKNDGALYVMLIPFVVWFIMFMYRPMFGLIIAFKDYNLFKGILGSEWVGLDNFREFIGGPYFGRTLKNTVIIGVLGLVFGFPAPILLALLLNEIRNAKIKSAVQTATFIPYLISTVVVAGMVVNMLSPSTGIVNMILQKLTGEKIYFLAEAKWFRPIYILTNIWKGCGYSAVIYISALTNIDQQLYEACVIDGGGKLKQIIHVTIPGILPTIAILFIMSVGGIINVGYELIILLYQPSTYETADVLSTYMFRTGIQEGNYGVGTAVTLFNSIISLIFVSSANFVSKRLAETSLW